MRAFLERIGYNLDSDEDIRLNETNCEESEECADPGLAAKEACHSVAILEWMATTYSKELDSMNIRLTTSSVGTGRIGVKW
ncbi:hypothetical protein TNCV_2642991 [Trichonephila clavipes]|nr:hypothetical protein TNCV_2642991 [Trichonephila clavipes]